MALNEGDHLPSFDLPTDSDGRVATGDLAGNI